MKPTMHLRWKFSQGNTQHTQPVLQQWWEGSWSHETGEWRDVMFSSNISAPPEQWHPPGTAVMD